MKYVEIPTLPDNRPHCKYCGYDGNLSSMRLYEKQDGIPFDYQKCWQCDICGHEETLEEMEKTTDEINSNGFSDYTIDQ